MKKVFAVIYLASLLPACAQERPLPNLYLKFLNEEGKEIALQDGVIRVPNDRRIRFEVMLKTRALEDPIADLFIKARNQHPDTKRAVTVTVSVRRILGEQKQDVPVRIYSSGGGKSLTIHYVRVDLDILDEPAKREAEIRQALDEMLAEAARQGAAGVLGGLSERKDQMIAHFDEGYVNNPPGYYEISAVYASQDPQYWTGRLHSKPAQVLVEFKSSFLDRIREKAKR